MRIDFHTQSQIGVYLHIISAFSLAIRVLWFDFYLAAQHSWVIFSFPHSVHWLPSIYEFSFRSWVLDCRIRWFSSSCFLVIAWGFVCFASSYLFFCWFRVRISVLLWSAVPCICYRTQPIFCFFLIIICLYYLSYSHIIESFFAFLPLACSASQCFAHMYSLFEMFILHIFGLFIFSSHL